MGKSGYGRLYVEAGASAQALNATPGTFNKLTCFASDGITDGGVTVANANDNVILPSEAGGGAPMPVHVYFSLSFTVGTAGLYRFAIYKDNVVVPGSERRITGATSTTYTVTGHALVLVAEGAATPTFDLRAASDQVSPNVTVSYGSLEVQI
jgi:hypothetical protein